MKVFHPITAALRGASKRGSISRTTPSAAKCALNISLRPTRRGCSERHLTHTLRLSPQRFAFGVNARSDFYFAVTAAE
jgi:hypothetical protein